MDADAELIDKIDKLIASGLSGSEAVKALLRK